MGKRAFYKKYSTPWYYYVCSIEEKEVKDGENPYSLNLHKAGEGVKQCAKGNLCCGRGCS